MTFFLKYIRFILRHSIIIIIGTVIISAVAAVVLLNLKIDNSVDVFFNKNGDRFINFEHWKDQFGTDEVVIVALEAEDIFTVRNLSLISHLTHQFEALEYVDQVTSLTNVNTTIGQDRDFIIEHLIEDIPQGDDGLAALKEEAVHDPLYVKNVISSDGTVSAILVELERYQGKGKDDSHKKQVILKIEDILKEAIPSDVAYHITGSTAIEYFYAAYMQEDFKAFMPFLFLMIIVVMYLSFRSVKLVVLPLLAILVSVVCTMALLHLLGYSVNNVTTIIPPILMAIIIADSVHVIGEGIARRRIDGKEGFLEKTIQHLFFPCFLTSATTAFGFWSLTLSTIPPVRQLGIVVGCGVFFAFIITFTFVPALAKFGGMFENRHALDVEPQGSKFTYLLKWIAMINVRYYKQIIFIGIGIVCISVWGASKIKAETSVIEYFKPSTPIYQATIFVEDRLSGVHTLNVSLRSTEENYFQSPAALNEIEEITAFLYSIPEVDKVMSVNDYIKEINRSFHNEDKNFYRLPDTQKMVAQYVLLYGREDLEDFVDDPWQWATIRIRLKEHSTVKLEGVIAKIENFLKKYEKPGFTVQVVGQTALEVESNNAVTKGQIQSLGMAMAVIFGMMFLVFRSFPVGLVSIPPNILPILMNFGIMGFFGIRLDSATSMIAAVGIGIVVDDTIHFLHGIGEALKKTHTYAEAVEMTFQERGKAIVLTSVILFFGFGILSFSRFIPTAYFGMLTAILMLNALIADLFITPSLLLWLKPPFKGAVQ